MPGTENDTLWMSHRPGHWMVYCPSCECHVFISTGAGRDWSFPLRVQVFGHRLAQSLSAMANSGCKRTAGPIVFFGDL